MRKHVTRNIHIVFDAYYIIDSGVLHVYEILGRSLMKQAKYTVCVYM